MNSTVIIVASVLLTAFFIFSGSIKVFGWQKMIFNTQLEFFLKYGLNRRLMALVGFIELFGALTLWLPGYIGLLGIFVLLGTSAGAITFHLRFDTWKDSIPAVITLILSSLVAYSKYIEYAKVSI